MPETECEFKEYCGSYVRVDEFNHACVPIEEDTVGECLERQRFLNVFNSPQFKKQYANISEVLEALKKARKPIYEAEDTETYGFNLGLDEAKHIIKTHGLEEKE